jgi:hypothetical protein
VPAPTTITSASARRRPITKRSCGLRPLMSPRSRGPRPRERRPRRAWSRHCR